MNVSVWINIDSAFDLRCAQSKGLMPNWIACFSSGERSPKTQQGDFSGIAS
jgi:hypothetical protein